VVEQLLIKCKALSSYPSSNKKKVLSGRLKGSVLNSNPNTSKKVTKIKKKYTF
jgi:hypothetical protein